MKITKETENELALTINPAKGMDIISIGIYLALIVVPLLIAKVSIVSILIIVAIILSLLIIPGYLWFHFFPIKIHIDKQLNVISYKVLNETQLQLDKVKNIEFNKSAFANSSAFGPPGTSNIVYYLIPGITFVTDHGERITLHGYIFSYAPFEQLGKKLASFMNIPFEK